MTTALKRSGRLRGPDTGRRVVGSVAELGIKAYGGAAVVSVALSDAETISDKRDAAIGALPHLWDRFHDAQYVIEHREQIQMSLDYVGQNAPEPEQFEAAAQESSETLGAINTTYDEILEAKDSIGFGPGAVSDAVEHVGNAWDAMPELGSLEQLAEAAKSAAPFVEHVEVLIPVLYSGLLNLVDNFASDELGSTLTVMAAAVAVAFVLGNAVGFLGRRGRPGLVAHTLQGWGARLFRGWYVRNLEYALGPELYSVAREHTQKDLLADPEAALDPEAFEELELYFERRALEQSTVLSKT